jgi:hypothetical protein
LGGGEIYAVLFSAAQLQSTEYGDPVICAKGKEMHQYKILAHLLKEDDMQISRKIDRIILIWFLQKVTDNVTLNTGICHPAHRQKKDSWEPKQTMKR